MRSLLYARGFGPPREISIGGQRIRTQSRYRIEVFFDDDDAPTGIFCSHDDLGPWIGEWITLLAAGLAIHQAQQRPRLLTWQD